MSTRVMARLRTLCGCTKMVDIPAKVPEVWVSIGHGRKRRFELNGTGKVERAYGTDDELWWYPYREVPE